MNLHKGATKKKANHGNQINFDELINTRIKKPGRYIGNELGSHQKSWDEAKVHWVLTYPELYEIGASNLGHIILYSILNEIPGQLCDRAYLPGTDLIEHLRENTQTLFAIESRKPLLIFDIVGFSLSYELGATNILEMLDLGGIPIYAKDRGEDIPITKKHSFPIIFAGGPTATSNPEPYADFFDFFALGDGEELLPEIGLVMAEAKKNNLCRSELLSELSIIPGVYVPTLYKQGRNHISVEPIKSSTPSKVLRRVATPLPHYGIGLVPNIETVHDRLTIEIRRGCTKGCRFCQPGMITRPARDVAPQDVIQAVERGMTKTGYSDFSLLSLSCSDYLSLPSVGIELRNRLSQHNITLNLPSQRIDNFDENIANILGGTRKAGLTFAPEAGTQILRDTINKNLTDEDLLKGVRNAMHSGYKKIKLYFMIGLPSETENDVIAISSTCSWLQKQSSDLGQLKLNITISNFTPKPHTPFQWHSVSKRGFERKQNILKKAFSGLKNIKVNFTDVRISTIEDFISRGDRRIASVIEAAWRAGAGMDAWFESQDRAYQAWMQSIKVAGLEEKYRKFEMESLDAIEKVTNKKLFDFCLQPLPWDHIDSGVTKKWLIQDLQRSLQKRAIPDCSFDLCTDCGVCGNEFGNNEVIEPPPIPKYQAPKTPPTEKKSRIRLRFSKTNPLHLIGHLDLLRLFKQSLRRAGLPVSFTGGFHPMPRIQIALALPIGIEAFGELMDIFFFKKVDPLFVKELLQQALPNGIQILSAEEISLKQPTLSKEINLASWTFSLNCNANKYQIKLSDWNRALHNLLDSENLIWNDTDKKGRPRQKDYKYNLVSLEIMNKFNDIAADPCLNNAKIKLITRIDSMGRSISPRQITFWLNQYFRYELEIKNIKRNYLHFR